MQDLTKVLKNRDWIDSHIVMDMNSKENKFNIEFRNFYLLPELRKETGNGSIFVFIDTNTDLLYKLEFGEVIDIANLEKHLLFRILAKLNLKVYNMNIVFSLHSIIINFDTARIKAREEFLVNYISKLEGTSVIPEENSNFTKYIKVKYLYKVSKVRTKESPLDYVKKYLNYNYNDEITLSELTGYAKEFFHKHYDTMYENYLNSYKDDICTQFILDSVERFSGTYKLSHFSSQYNGFFESDIDYDTFNLEINMVSGYDENVEFIKDNSKEINKCIWTVMRLHPATREYYKNLEMLNVALSRGNILIAQFKVNE